MDSEALKPCPFCGGEAKYYYYTPRDHNIECESCSNGTCLHETKAEAITAWNTRADDDRIEALKADKAKLREALVGLTTDDDDPCWFDHAGNCQAHFITNPCEMAFARKALQETER